MKPMEVRGRFLPSRIYSRWRWTVRTGLLLVPLLVFLSGALILYLSPNRYKSTTLIELENGPPVSETLELLGARPVLERVIERFELTHRLELDREALIEVLQKATRTWLVPDTRMIRITATHTQKDIAREIAEGIPLALIDYLGTLARERGGEKAAEFELLIRQARDIAEEHSARVVNLEKVHGSEEGGDAAVPLDRARRALLLADAEIERLQAMKSAALIEKVNHLPRLLVHEQPLIAAQPFQPAMGPDLNETVVKSLLAGLLFALLVPYLLELAFPPRKAALSATQDEEF